jgi:lactate permease
VLALTAALPIAVVLVLMVGLRWPASRAGLVGATLAFVLGITVFDLGTGTPTGIGPVDAYLGVASEALFTSATILWIVVPALAIHHLQVATGATEQLRRALGRLAADPRILALLIGWFFALFVEGAAGFGASVALAAPFLVGVGYRPVDAVVVAMLGHAIGVSFGAIGTPIVPQVAASGIPGVEIAGATATLHLVAGWSLLAVMVVVASRAVGSPARGAIWGWAALAGASFLVPFWLLATFVGPELPTLAGAVVGAGVFVVALKLVQRRPAGVSGEGPVETLPAMGEVADPAPPFERRWGTSHPVPPGVPEPPPLASRPDGSEPQRDGPDMEHPAARELLLASAPYLVLIGLVLVTRLVPPVRDALGAVELAWTLEGGFRGSFAPLTHPGTLLAVSFLGGAAIRRVGTAAVVAALRTTTAQLAGVTVALIAMLTLARLMVHSGMTPALAEAAAGTVGSGWPVVAPLVGVLGTFVTGSATASNVLFTDLQLGTADTLGLPQTELLAAQNYGAAVGNIVCPHNIVAAGATVGLTGAEGDVLRRTLVPALGYGLLGGLLVLVAVGLA